MEAIRAGLNEIVKVRNEIRMGPVDLRPAQEVRLQRLDRRSVLRAAEGLIFITEPTSLVPGLIEFIQAMWPSTIGASP